MEKTNIYTITSYCPNYEIIYQACKLIQRMHKEEKRIYCTHIFYKDKFIYATDSKIMFKIPMAETLTPGSGVYKIIKVIRKNIILEKTGHDMDDCMPNMDEVLQLNLKDLKEDELRLNNSSYAIFTCIKIYDFFNKIIREKYISIIQDCFDGFTTKVTSNKYKTSPVIFDKNDCQIAVCGIREY